MIEQEFIKAQHRIKIGRAQKDYSAARRAMYAITWENYIWTFFLFIITVIYFIKEREIEKIAKFFSVELLQNLTLEVFITIAVCILGRITYNLIVRALLNHGMNRYKHMSNIIASATDSLISLPLFIIFCYTLIRSGKIIIPIHGSLLDVLTTLLLPAGEAEPSVLLFICALSGIFVAGLLMSVLLFFHGFYISLNFFNSLNLLPADNEIKKNSIIKNYHYSDYCFLKELYLNTMNRNSPQNVYTAKDFDLFLKNTGTGNIRLLFNGTERVGFYSFENNHSTLQDIMIAPDHKGKEFHKVFINDFEKINSTLTGITKRKITISLPVNDSDTLNFLTKEGWEITRKNSRNTVLNKNV